MPKNDHYVIIGNGPAGNSAADTLRDKDDEARITIITDERIPYYYRNKLPGFAAGKEKAQNLQVRPYSVYVDKNIRVRLGQRVDRIDPAKRLLYLNHMETVGYSRLILATGGRPRILQGHERFDGLFYHLARHTDALALKPKLAEAKEITVLGGDLTSMRLADLLLTMQKQIDFILFPECFWPIVLTEEMAAGIVEKMSGRGIRAVIKGSAIKDVMEENRRYRIEFETGERAASDLIVAMTGLTPNVDFIIGSGIDVERGVLVDDHLRTNYDDIYACGDCAQIYNPELKNWWVSIGWANALRQGEIAALNLLGDNRVIQPVTQKALEFEGITVNTSWWQEF
jgi:nitrite reductase (NADH) large subunit